MVKGLQDKEEGGGLRICGNMGWEKGCKGSDVAKGIHVLPSLCGIAQEASTGLGKTATFVKRGEDRRCLINGTQFIDCLSQKSLGHSRESFRFCLIFEK